MLNREDIIVQVMRVTPTKYAHKAIEVLDSTPDSGLLNLQQEIQDDHGREVWRVSF